MNTILVPTTQNIELEYPVAGLGDRIISGLIDLAVIFLYLLAWTQILDAYEQASLWDALVEDRGSDTIRTLQVLIMVPAVCYSLLCEVFFQGRTLGKWLMKLQTIRLDGASPGLSHYLVRWVLRILDVWITLALLAPGLVSVITLGISNKGQRLGDMIAGTTVVKLKLVTTFVDTIFMDTGEAYEMVFPEIRHLSDRDVSILKEVLDAGIRSDNPQLLDKLSSKVQEVAGIESRMEARHFLETVLRDYNHYYGRD
jgi:uncharacterized RDD family membrane protein YckC